MYYSIIRLVSFMSNLNQNELKALRFIRNSLIHLDRSPSVRDIMNDLEYKSPRSATLIIDSLIEKGFLKKDSSKKLKLIKEPDEYKLHTKTVEVPIVGSAPCGYPFLAEQNIKMTVPVSMDLAKPPFHYFLLRAVGDSMNRRGINDGNLILVRQQPTADSGEVVVALIDDEATIKEFYQNDDTVALMPKSTNNEYKPIIVANGFQIQGVVVKTLENIYD